MNVPAPGQLARGEWAADQQAARQGEGTREAMGHNVLAELCLALLTGGGKSQYVNSPVVICKSFSSKGGVGVGRRSSIVIVYVAIQGSQIREDGPRKEQQNETQVLCTSSKGGAKKGCGTEGHRCKGGETGEGGVEHETERNTRGLPGGDTLQGTYFHSMFLFREVTVSVHFHGPGITYVNLILTFL